MSKNGPIIVIDDDQKEHEVYKTDISETGIKNRILFFDNGREALDFLTSTKEDPFLIICDVSMPKMDGLDLRRQIIANPYLKMKATPFVFRTSSASNKDIQEAFELSVQGFFSKTKDPIEVKKLIQVIVDYWTFCLQPQVMEIKIETL